MALSLCWAAFGVGGGHCHPCLSFPSCATCAQVKGCIMASGGASHCPHHCPQPQQHRALCRPPLNPSHGKVPAWQAARFLKEENINRGNPGEIPRCNSRDTRKQGQDGTPPPHQHPHPSRHPPSPTTAPTLTSRPRPWLRASPPGGAVCPRSSGSGVPAGCAPLFPASVPARLSTPARLSVPAGRTAPCPMAGGSPRGHLPLAAVPGEGKQGQVRVPHPAAPRAGRRRGN